MNSNSNKREEREEEQLKEEQYEHEEKENAQSTPDSNNKNTNRSKSRSSHNSDAHDKVNVNDIKKVKQSIDTSFTQEAKIEDNAIIAGGTNSMLCKEHASIIVGLFDFYQ